MFDKNEKNSYFAINSADNMFQLKTGYFLTMHRFRKRNLDYVHAQSMHFKLWNHAFNHFFGFSFAVDS